MLLHFEVIGWFLIVLALTHVVFPWYFAWRTELSQLSMINRQMMQVHTFFIAFTVLLMGILCLTSSAELATTPLGRKICLGLALFWSVRLVIQLFGYSSKLWRGKAFETTIHAIFSILWLYLSAAFWWVYVRS